MSGVRVTLCRALVDLFAGAAPQIVIEGDTVQDIVHGLDRLYPGMADRLADETPAIRRHLNIFVDGRKATLATVVAPASTVYIITAVSGG